ncbi:hypothetical protein [Frankia sp. Cppng1_Ct_nod]|nr:hypothetical protein [Frankia sp. Cppng1_Ct_nod]
MAADVVVTGVAVGGVMVVRVVEGTKARPSRSRQGTMAVTAKAVTARAFR